MSEFIVEMRNVTKKFPGIIANNNVSLQIKKGEIYALLGENGAGKSTLMSMLFGMYEPDGGEILIRGKKVLFKSAKDATKHNIGMVHQHFKLIDNYTITENIVLGMEPKGKWLGFLPSVGIKAANEEIRELSMKYGLEVDPTKMIQDLNISIQQRVEILKMLYREAEILIFDEPTAVLTPQEITFLLQIIRELRNAGKTIILITHKLEEIKKVADRCAILCRGELIEVLDVKETSTKQMANLMVGREISFELEKKEAQFKEVILEVDQITVKNHDNFSMVKDMSFSIRGGEIFAIAGVSGNGQVELADAIAGLMKVSKGTIRLKGKDITNYSIRNRAIEGISYIPEDRQKYGLILEFNLEDNLCLRDYYKPTFCEKGILKKAKFQHYGEELIEKYDIRCGQGNLTQVRSMSGGNQQKAIIGREIEQSASLIIFVQPTRGLDIGAIANVHEEMIKQRDKGHAILLISLELEEIMNCADTIGIIYNGEILKIADAKDLTVHEVGEYMMGVKSHEKK